MSARPLVTLYGRPGCHLCEAALADLRKLADRLEFDLSEVNIEADDALLARYVFEIPVVALDGAEIGRAPIVWADIEEALVSRLR